MPGKSPTSNVTLADVVAQNVRAEMARSSYTQASLAPKLHLSQQALSERLRGKVKFDINEIGSIATVLGVPLSALVPNEAVA